MISVLVLSAVYCGFIGGVMISVLVLSVVYCGFIGGVMISVLVLSVVYCGFEPWSSQTKDYGIWLFRIISIPSKVSYFRLTDHVIFMEC